MAPGFRLRLVRADECAALVGFVASLNRSGVQHCLHFADTEAGIRADIDKGQIDLTQAFWLAEAGTQWLGAAGVVRDGNQGWLYGPWCKADGDAAITGALIEQARAAPDLRLLHAFTDVRSVAIVQTLSAAGFVQQHQVHMMRATPGEVLPVDSGDCEIGPARSEDTASLVALHETALPHSGLSGRAMLQHARRAGRLFVARSAAGTVLGSLCLAIDSANREANREAELEFLAVQADARGRGIGRALTRAALHHAFDAAQCKAVSLCVDEHNTSALRLYESCAFKRVCSGIKQRWQPRGE